MKLYKQHPAKRRSRVSRRRPWTPKEDEAIRCLVQKHGSKQWTLIAQKLSADFGIAERTSKQCRERWHNHLDPAISKEAWSLHEELILFRNYKVFGHKWAEVAKFLLGRTDNSIKNHFYAALRKEFRKKFGGEASQTVLKQHVEELAASILHTLTAEASEHLSNEDTASDVDLTNLPPLDTFSCWESEQMWSGEYPSEYCVMPFSPFDDGRL